ncbi:MAG: aminotransferase class IV [Verrucomicrobia bacterium]|nr:aminotransferase class IV [Verrucomicrobiota bacterium]
MNEPLAYLNGQFIPNNQCVLPIYDAGIVLGAAVTDLLRTFRGRSFAAKEHVRRFFESARYAYIDLSMSEAEMLAIVERIITHNVEAWPGREVALVFYATAGQFPVYAGAAGMAGEMRATVCLHCFPLPLQLWKHAIAEGVHVVTPAQRHIHPATLNSKIKHRNRLHMWIGDQQAKLADPKAIGLYLDHDGNITETGGSNFLILKDGTILSPRRNNILWGVTLETVRRLCGPLGLQFADRDLLIHDVVNADEAWLCTTPYFLAPVVKINGISVASGQPGATWRRLMDAFSAEVGVDVAQQILDSP